MSFGYEYSFYKRDHPEIYEFPVLKYELNFVCNKYTESQPWKFNYNFKKDEWNIITKKYEYVPVREEKLDKNGITEEGKVEELTKVIKKVQDWNKFELEEQTISTKELFKIFKENCKWRGKDGSKLKIL